jgi:hypothetical protein
VLDEVTKWLNDNQGVLTLLIFLVTLFLGWVSGAFASLRRKPKLRLELRPGPTLCTTFLTGEKHQEYDVHRTAISLYLRITNIGSAPTSIERVSVGYHWHLNRLGLLWFRYRVFWFWLDQVVTMENFRVNMGDWVKIYPALFQGNAALGTTTNTYLEVGRATGGVVYFEQKESWGACFPSPRGDQAKIKVKVTDAFGRNYRKRFWIPVVTLEEAKRYNPSFGGTIPAVRSEPV